MFDPQCFNHERGNKLTQAQKWSDPRPQEQQVAASVESHPTPAVGGLKEVNVSWFPQHKHQLVTLADIWLS